MEMGFAAIQDCSPEEEDEVECAEDPTGEMSVNLSAGSTSSRKQHTLTSKGTSTGSWSPQRSLVISLHGLICPPVLSPDLGVRGVVASIARISVEASIHGGSCRH